MGDYYRVLKGDTKSLDHGSYNPRAPGYVPMTGEYLAMSDSVPLTGDSPESNLQPPHKGPEGTGFWRKKKHWCPQVLALKPPIIL